MSPYQTVRAALPVHGPSRHAYAMVRAVLAALLMVGVLSGCASRGGPIAYDPPGFTAPDQGSSALLTQDSVLFPLDELKVTVFRVEDLSGTYQVSVDGFVEMPLIGRVDVRNMSASQLSGELEARYSQRYLQNPDITVQVLKSPNRTFTVDGGVAAPGVYPLAGKSNLISAVASAGGVSLESGNARRIAILRKIDGETQAAAFDLVAIRRGEMANPDVYPGDLVIVDGNALRSIYRELLATIPLLAVFNSL